MQGESAIESVLVADCGSTTTRVYLFDLVGGEYRFIAKGESPTTTEPPYRDVTLGIRNALQSIQSISGREFAIEGRLIMPQNAAGDGADLFLLAGSAARPLVVAVADTTQEGADTCAGAVRSTFSTIGSISRLDEATRGSEAAWSEAEIEKLRSLEPDVIVAAGGLDGDPPERVVQLLRTVAAALPENTEDSRTRCQVIYVGNEKARDEARELLESRSEFLIGNNIRPKRGTQNTAYVHNQLNSAYRDRALAALPGVGSLGASGETTLTSTFECTEKAIRFLGKHYQRDVLGIDCGGSSVTTILTTGDAYETSVLAGMGLSYGISNLLAAVGAGRVARWLPFQCDEEEIANWAFNKVLRPFMLPMRSRELAIEQAFAREAIQYAYRLAQRGERPYPIDLIVGSGGVITHVANVAQAAMLMLDAIQPTGETTGSAELVMSATEVLVPIGAMSKMLPDGAAEVFDRDALLWLGPVIVPLGQGTIGEKAVKVTAESTDGEFNSIEVPYGSIAVIPLRADQRAVLTVEPAPNFRIGQGAKGEAVRTSPGEEIRGGLVGLIIDARGRPLVMPEEQDKRVALMREWWTAIGAFDNKMDTQQ